MIVERPDIDSLEVLEEIRSLDDRIEMCIAGIPDNIRAVKWLPVLLHTRLSYLLASERCDSLECELAADEVLDAYESLMRSAASHRSRESGSDGLSGGSGAGRPTVTIADFFNAFWIAVIRGDRRRLDFLAELPMDVFVVPGVDADRFLYAWAETLQLFYKRDERWAQSLGDAIFFSDPDRVEYAADDVLHYLLYPAIKLFYTFVTGTGENFNIELEDALVRHRYYWTAHRERELMFEGWVSYPLTAITCMAISRGYNVIPESDYLPVSLGMEK